MLEPGPSCWPCPFFPPVLQNSSLGQARDGVVVVVGYAGEWQTGPQVTVVLLESYVYLFSGPHPSGPGLPLHAPAYLRRCGQLGDCLLPGIPPDQLLEMLCGGCSSTVFSMMQAICSLGRGYRCLAGPAPRAHPCHLLIPPQPSFGERDWSGARCLLSPVCDIGLRRLRRQSPAVPLVSSGASLCLQPPW